MYGCEIGIHRSHDSNIESSDSNLDRNVHSTTAIIITIGPKISRVDLKDFRRRYNLKKKELRFLEFCSVGLF